MNATASARRSDHPLQIGGRHGYRIDGDLVTIHAELSVPPYHPGGAWTVELWASECAHQGGELSGTKLGEVQFELPTPLAPHTHRVEAQVPARLPPQGRSRVMLLALVEQWSGQVQDVAQYSELESFPAPHFEGEVGYAIRGCEVTLQAAEVVNPRAAGNLSGTLSLELWALPAESATPAGGGPGHCLAAAQLAPVAGGQSVLELQCRAAFSEPPPGRFQLWLRLCEWVQALGYVTRDERAFALPYEASEPLTVSATTHTRASDEPAPAPEVAPALPVARSSAVVPRSSRAVSIQTASVEELARVKGLNTRIAKEIIQARPFASLDELLKVRGIGRKTLDRIRALVTL